jgi:S-adenosylmethionine decarboxylase proenzyme
MDTFGRHLLAEYCGCDVAILQDVDAIERLMVHAATKANATVVQSAFHRFSPQGVSGVVLIEESHLSIHTWPEHGFAAVDFLTCGKCMPDAAHAYLAEALGARSYEVLLVHRGMNHQLSSRPSMEVVMHDRGVVQGANATERQPQKGETA